MTPKFRATLIAVSLFLASCSFAPEYHPPDLSAAPQKFKEFGDWQTARPADDLPRGEWWRAFNDETLNTLEARIIPANQDLQAALARYREAQAQSSVAIADFFPTVTASISADHEKASKNTANYRAGSTTEYYSDDRASFAASYEIDVWGRLRNAAAAADAITAATAADVQALNLMLNAELAGDYFTLRGYDEQIKLLDDTVKTYDRALTLTQNRFTGKIASEIDVSQAKAQLESARGDYANLNYRRAQLEHAVAVLVGEPASTFTIAPGNLAAIVPPVGPGLPSTLLERRPDVAAAERRVFAANAEIGVARAAYFPVFSLDAVFGVESKSVGSWFTAPSQMWSVGPSALLTVFDAGRIDALVATARAQYDQTVASYRKTALVAFQEVEDALAGQRLLSQELENRKAAAEAAQRALDQANRLYEAGLVNYLQVVTAQTTALQTQETVANIHAQRLNATVSLLRALGGGWIQINQPPLSQPVNR